MPRAASSTCPPSSRWSANERSGGRPAPLPRAGRDRRRPAPLLEPDLHARRDRLQAALLRLGARLPLDARPPAAAVRHALLRLHEDRQVRRGRPVLPRLPAERDRALHVLRRDHQPRRDGAGRAREPAAQDALPAHGDPALGGAPLALQPRPEPDRGVRLHLRLGHHADARLAADPAADRDARDLRDRGDDAAVGALRALPRRRADLGGGAAAALLRLADHLRDRAGARERARAGHVQPDRHRFSPSGATR